jgi:RNA polymerase sigma-70 factor (ECF subfamily)
VRVDLVERAQKGDREAFDILMLESIDRLYAIARLTAQDTDVAEDAVQEALIKCWRDLPTLRHVDRFEAWLHRLLMNSVAEEFRKRRRVRATVTVLRLETNTADASADLADRDELQRAFSLLSIEHRVVLVVHHYLGMSTDEAATVLGIPPGTVKSRLHYALEAMRAALESADRAQRDREMPA